MSASSRSDQGSHSMIIDRIDISAQVKQQFDN
jgi:hypothetical protein